MRCLGDNGAPGEAVERPAPINTGVACAILPTSSSVCMSLLILAARGWPVFFCFIARSRERDCASSWYNPSAGD